METEDRDTTARVPEAATGAAAEPEAGRNTVEPGSIRECLADDTGATTAEYAITTLAACGFAALLVVVLKSDPLKEMITGVITGALGLGGA
jgi:Flp pilus assembly pilin Flp